MRRIFPLRRDRLVPCGGLALTVLLRARAALFGWLWFIIATLPIAFIPGRTGMVLYIPLPGLAVGLADLLRTVVRKTAGETRYLNPAATPAFLLISLCLLPVNWRLKQAADAAPRQQANQFREFAADLRQFGPARRGASLLYLRDPFLPGRFDPEFLASLLRRQHDLRAARAKRNLALLAPAVVATYDDVYDFDRGHLRWIAPAERPQVLDRLRAQSGFVEPRSGIVDPSSTTWWTEKNFAVAVHCPASATQCVLVMEVATPSPVEACTVAVDVAGVTWRNFRLEGWSAGYPIQIPVRSRDSGTPVAFHVSGGGAGSSLPALVVSSIRLN